MIEQLIIVIHVLIALAIIGLILLQQGKGADMGASFGGGGSQTLFGPGGSGNVLTRATAIFATLFFVTSFGLAVIAKEKVTAINTDVLSELESVAVDQEQALPELDAVVDEASSMPLDIIEESEPADLVDKLP